MIGVIDCGIGNVESVKNMVHRAGGDACIISDPSLLSDIGAIILPGVGTFDHAMQRLEQTGFRSELDICVVERKLPFLGICIGMQLLFEESEEGSRSGLGWLQGRVKKFDFPFQESSRHLNIPHMGWNIVDVKSDKDSLMRNLGADPRFYFVHSYHVKVANSELVIAECDYGYRFPCVVRKDQIMGVQFHPEKSHKFGMRILNNFLEIIQDG